MVLFGKSNQILDQDDIPIFSGNMSVIVPEHLVDFAGDDTKIGFGQAVFEGCESQVEAALVVGEMPGLHIIAGCVIEFDLI